MGENKGGDRKKQRKTTEKNGKGMQNESKNRFRQRMLSICLLLEESTEGGGGVGCSEGSEVSR